MSIKTPKALFALSDLEALEAEVEHLLAERSVDLEKVRSWTAEVERLTAERDGLAKALRTVHEYSNQYVVSETARLALAALTPKEGAE